MPTEKETKRAEKFRGLAETLQAEIEQKRAPLTVNATARRLAIKASQERDADRLEEVQHCLRGIAADLDAGTLPPLVATLTNKKQIAEALSRGRNFYDTLDDADRSLVDALRAYIKPPSAEELRARELVAMERELVGAKIPGFFPTPPDLIERLLDLAEDGFGMGAEADLILEPSAGKGDIADAMRARWPTCSIDVCEIHATLRSILEAKGYAASSPRDFLDMAPAPVYRLIVMNPPFEKGQDRDHVRHAYGMLAPGGRLVAVVSEGVFTRTRPADTTFRKWLKTQPDVVATIPVADAFKGVQAFRQTGVSVRVLVLDKPASAKAEEDPDPTETDNLETRPMAKTTTKSKTTPVGGSLQQIPLAKLVPSPNNKRHLPDLVQEADRFADLRESLEIDLRGDLSEGMREVIAADAVWSRLYETAKSIRGVGLIEPVVARPLPDGRYELCCGHRRLLAHHIAGLETILTIVRDLDDQQSAEVTSVENLQRSDLSPLEEGEQIAVLLERGWNVAEVAAHIGKTETWVRRRAQVVQLVPAWREVLADTDEHSGLSRWGVGHMELIARYPAEVQERLVDGSYNFWQDQRVSDLRAELQEMMMELRAAPWSLDDAQLLRSAGACSACPKRSGCQLHLFEADERAEDRCLDEDCWEAKAAAYLEARLAALREEHGDDLRLVSTGYPRGEKLLAGDRWDVAKAGAKGALPALVMEDGGWRHRNIKVGDEIWIKLTSATGGTGGGTGATKTLAERRVELGQKRQAVAIAKVRELLTTSPEPTSIVESEQPLLDMLALVAGFGVAGPHWRDELKAWDAVDAAGKIEESELVRLLWERLRVQELLGELNHGSLVAVADCVPAAERICDLLCVSWPAILQEATDATPEPKSWAKLNADGTPKKPKAKKTKKKTESEVAS